MLQSSRYGVCQLHPMCWLQRDIPVFKLLPPPQNSCNAAAAAVKSSKEEINYRDMELQPTTVLSQQVNWCPLALNQQESEIQGSELFYRFCSKTKKHGWRYQILVRKLCFSIDKQKGNTHCVSTIYTVYKNKVYRVDDSFSFTIIK